ncbi:suppressor of fused domain protein [Williamsia sterculiae]|uniref:Suppressor of fused protein (SUFU) n=1 Tax=Williamsia sterculiae TaxID=1344003 RepID=A0A1N7E140_9NOCA|nr:suppressor of fused domain protein [Williamsia sterculiae]SIR81783.1 Suppressor of fused protein (SUFU) [Williamsia sterculiae]
MSDEVTVLVERTLRAAIGGEPQRASVTFVGVEPIDVLRFVHGDELVFATVGCARHPMGDPADLLADPDRGPRAELVVRMRASGPLRGLHRTLATVAAAPAVEGLVLTPDALLDIGETAWEGSSFSAFLLAEDTVGPCVLAEPREAVQFLRAVPITANEAAWVRLKGAEALRQAWDEAGIDDTDPNRASANPR